MAGAPGVCHSIALHSALKKETAIMATKALVQTRIDANVKEQATVVLENMGLTVSDAVRILLTRTAKEGALPFELLSNSEAHDAWFRAKVEEALNDKRPDADDATVEAHFAKRRAAALRKARRQT
jgi:DNA-damage-inducible protein J